jgi:hypothetical protein
MPAHHGLIHRCITLMALIVLIPATARGQDVTAAPPTAAAPPTDTAAPPTAAAAPPTSGAAAAAPPAQAEEAPERPTWGALDATGSGFLIGRTDLGEMSLSGYAVVRYINQLPATQTFVDHLGNTHVIDPRNDIQFHRAMLHFRGWLFDPKIRYQVTVWSVLSTNQTTLYGFAGYQFAKKFNAYAGINTIGGSRSVMGSHPFWLANDRVLADEFFRPGFTGTAWVNGELSPGFWYQVAAGNSLSQLGFTAKQLTRDIATGVQAWAMPTTKEFGPNGSFDDWEYHETLATRFGVSWNRSRENRFNQNANPAADNYQVKLADSLLLFSTDSLAPGVTVNFATVHGASVDAGLKYRGIFLQTEIYKRWIGGFDADGPLPVSSIHDSGFYVQGAFYPLKKKLELYGATSWIYGDRDAGFATTHEYIQGLNFYPANTRNVRFNSQVIEVDRSPQSSLFGFYVGGQKGTTLSSAFSFFF